MRLFSAKNFTELASVALHDDADNVRIDPRNGLAVVGYGSGGLALIDPLSRAKIADIKLPAHPEGFQIDPATGRAYVNLPGVRQIAVVDLDARRLVDTWPMREVRANFPLALDPSQSLVGSVFRSPPMLLLLDPASGAERQRLPACRDADDVFFDAQRARIYVSCGAGEVAVLERTSAGWSALSAIRTVAGARTSLFVPELARLFVVERHRPVRVRSRDPRLSSRIIIQFIGEALAVHSIRPLASPAHVARSARRIHLCVRTVWLPARERWIQRVPASDDVRVTRSV